MNDFSIIQLSIELFRTWFNCSNKKTQITQISRIKTSHRESQNLDKVSPINYNSIYTKPFHQFLFKY